MTPQRFALAAWSGPYHVSACFWAYYCVPLSAWNCSAIPSPCGWHQITTVAAFSCDYSAGPAKYITLQNQRPFVSYSSLSSLEQSSTACDIITVADSFSAASQDGTVCPVRWLKLVMTFCHLCLYMLFMLLIYWPSHFRIFIAVSWQLFMFIV